MKGQQFIPFPTTTAGLLVYRDGLTRVFALVDAMAIPVNPACRRD